jgi:hypothetical protein
MSVKLLKNKELQKLDQQGRVRIYGEPKFVVSEIS